MEAHPRPELTRPPFVRGDFGIDQNAVLPGKPLREFVSVRSAWGAQLELQRRDGESWTTVSSARLGNAETAGAWMETPDTQASGEAAYRYRLTRDGLEAVSEERVLRHVNPRDYTGLAAEAYALISPIRPATVIDVVVGPITSLMNPKTLAHAHQGYDRIELSDQLADGGSARSDVKTVVLHELGHLVQWDAYGGHATHMSEHLTAVFGPKLPLERSADCLMEHWGGLLPGNHFPYFEGEAKACTEALARFQPYWAPALGPPPEVTQAGG
jgi:hypothetical protein